LNDEDWIEDQPVYTLPLKASTDLCFLFQDNLDGMTDPARWARGMRRAINKLQGKFELHTAYVANKSHGDDERISREQSLEHIGKLQSVLKGIQRQLVAIFGHFKYWAMVAEESSFALEHFGQGGEVEYPARFQKGSAS
jgi:hypothetical protein